MMPITLQIIEGVFFVALGSVITYLVMTRCMPKSPLKFLRMTDYAEPPRGFIIGGLFVVLGLFLIVQAVRSLMRVL